MEHERTRGREVEEEDKGRIEEGWRRKTSQSMQEKRETSKGRLGSTCAWMREREGGPTPSTSVDPRPRNPSGRVHENVDHSKAQAKVSLPSGEPPRRRIQEHPFQHIPGFVASLPSLATRSVPRKDGDPLVCLVRILTAWIVQHT